MKISVFVILAVLSLAGAVAAQEKKIERKDLPPAVEKTVESQAQGATIRGFSQEKENGQSNYEAELTVNGHRKDVLIAANGDVVEIEEQVVLDSLPAAVRDGLQAKAGAGKIVKVESLSKHDKLVAYEAVVQTAGKKKEIQVDPTGKPLAHEE
jgi:uncharacterized membrane protein YkoI